MGDVIDINERQPHRVFEAMCINCRERWIAVVPAATPLKDIECPNRLCGPGYIINTGQEIDDE